MDHILISVRSHLDPNLSDSEFDLGHFDPTENKTTADFNKIILILIIFVNNYIVNNNTQ